jgi:hypothetical protein
VTAWGTTDTSDGPYCHFTWDGPTPLGWMLSARVMRRDPGFDWVKVVVWEGPQDHQWASFRMDSGLARIVLGLLYDEMPLEAALDRLQDLYDDPALGRAALALVESAASRNT